MTFTGSSRRGSRKAGSSAWLTAQLRHLARRTQIRGLPRRRTYRGYPGQKIIRRRQDGQRGRGTSTSRPAAA